MIRKRRRKKTLELEREHRRQIGLILGGAVLAATLAAVLPSSCNTPPVSEDQLREQLEDLAQDSQARRPEVP